LPTPSREQLVFTADRNFRLWRYGVGHSQLLLRSLPTDDERCLDVHFEAVTWLSLPTSFDRLTISARPDLPPGIPPETRLLPDGRSLLTLSLQTSATTGTVVCANVKAAYSAWTPTDPDAEADEVVWALRFA
jgi:hypothetical protein